MQTKYTHIADLTTDSIHPDTISNAVISKNSEYLAISTFKPTQLVMLYRLDHSTDRYNQVLVFEPEHSDIHVYGIDIRLDDDCTKIMISSVTNDSCLSIALYDLVYEYTGMRPAFNSILRMVIPNGPKYYAVSDFNITTDATLTRIAVSTINDMVTTFTLTPDDSIITQQLKSKTNCRSKFGQAISMSSNGSYLAVGAPNDLISTKGQGGAVYVYRYALDAEEWELVTRVLPVFTNANIDYDQCGFGQTVYMSKDGHFLTVGIGHNSIIQPDILQIFRLDVMEDYQLSTGYTLFNRVTTEVHISQLSKHGFYIHDDRYIGVILRTRRFDDFLLVYDIYLAEKAMVYIAGNLDININQHISICRSGLCIDDVLIHSKLLKTLMTE